MSPRNGFLIELPPTPKAMGQLSLEQIRERYRELAAAPLDAGTLEPWLATWSRLEALLSEAASLAMIRYTCDTTDPAKEREHLRISSEILPQLESDSIGLARRLVETGLQPAGLETTIRRFRTAIELFREESVPLFAELEEHSAAYQRITGGMTAEWDGERIALPRLAPFLLRPERAIRERAFRAGTAPYLDAREELAGRFDRMYELRQRIARHAGFTSFRDYIFPAKFRFDYGPDDCLRFQEAVERTVVPAVRRLLAERRARLATRTLRPWDLAVNPYRPEPIHPYRDPDDLPRVARRIFGAVDPVFGTWFQTMMDENCLDLHSRTGKAPGGYCDTLQVRGRPFIFMNASGVLDDVMTLVHEAGHAFHGFAAHALPYLWQRHPGSESAELASMSMELLAGEHLPRPLGFLTEEEAAVARLERLEDILTTLAHIASVDAFQHWIYTSGEGGDSAARDAAWLRVRARFEPEVDWGDLAAERIARWYRQLHIFIYPFYYIEYGLAQLGALQVWRNALEAPSRAVAAYRGFLALGATRPLPELYAAAGARLVFDAEGMEELVDLVEDRSARLRAALPRRPVAPPSGTREIGRG